MYTVTVLKGKYQPGFVDGEGNFEHGTFLDYIEEFKNKARDMRFIVRDFSFNPTSLKDSQDAIAALDVEVDRLWVRLGS